MSSSPEDTPEPVPPDVLIRRHLQYEYRLINPHDGGIAISFQCSDHDALLRARAWRNAHPMYEIELVKMESWSSDWRTIDRTMVGL